MLDHHLSVGIRYAREQVPYSGVGLFINFVLIIGNGFCLADIDIVGSDSARSDGFERFLVDGTSDVMADTIDMEAQLSRNSF